MPACLCVCACVCTWGGGVGLCVCGGPSRRGLGVLPSCQGCGPLVLLHFGHPGHGPLAVDVLKLLHLGARSPRIRSHTGRGGEWRTVCMEGFNGNTFSLFLTHKSHVRLTKINNINNVFKMAFTILDYVNNKNVCSYYTFLNKPCIYICKTKSSSLNNHLPSS